ncbi:MAG: c-type cytochrome [Candidatus Rokubacteria bacterium]|nr:c-type cytochrome [Candidatus Rokubacteria bacterium]
MKWMVGVVSFLLLWGLEAGFPQSLFSPTQDPLSGSRVFGTKGCVKCHAVSGVGGTVGPDLGRIPRPRSFYELAGAMWNHLPRMAERMRELGITRPQLDPRETGDLIGFLYTLDYFDRPGNGEIGRRLFTEKKCVVCHQAGGTGGVVGPNLDFLRQFGSPILIAAELWNHGPAMAEAMRAKGIERPTFKDAELRDLIAYLKTASQAHAEEPLYVLPGRADEGRRLFTEKRCIECHSVRGEGARVGPDLAERGLHWSLTQFAAAMWNKAPAMMKEMKARAVSVPRLQAREMADLVAYLYAVRYFAEPGDPRKGRALVTAKGCLGCHSLEAVGGTVGPDLARARGLDSAAAVISALWNHGFVMAERAERRQVAWPRFRPEEMADLVAFLQSPAPSR